MPRRKTTAEPPAPEASVPYQEPDADGGVAVEEREDDSAFDLPGDDDDDDDDDGDNADDEASAEVGDEVGDDEHEADEDGQLSALRAADVPMRSVDQLRFRSVDEAKITRNGFLLIIDKLKKVEKDERSLGREREANSARNTVALITDVLLPQLQLQPSLQFDETESLPHAVARVVGATVRDAMQRGIQGMSHMEGESHEDMRARRKELIKDFEAVVGAIAENAAAAVIPVLQETAVRAYQEGLRARVVTPETLAREAVQAVRERRSA